MIDTLITREMVMRETDRAFLVRVESGVTRFGGARQAWLPKSQCEWRNSGMGFCDTLFVPAWLARKAFG